MRRTRDTLDERALRQLLDRAAGAVEPLSDAELARAARAASQSDDRERVLQLAGRGGAARRPSRPARLALALAAALVLALLGGIGLGRQLAPVAESAEAPVLPPRAPAFAAVEGWTVDAAVIDVPPGTQALLASNVPIERRGGSLELLDADALAALPEDGILISVSARAADEAAEERGVRAAASLRLRDAEVTTRWEGEPGRERPLAEYALSTVWDGLFLDVRVVFGAAEPSARSLAAAQAQLDRLSVRAAADRVTISARPGTVRWGEPIALSGAVSAAQAGERVMIEIRECGTDYWRAHEIATTTSGGQWFTETSVPINARLRARWGDATSAPVAVATRPGVVLTILRAPRIRVSLIGARSFWRKIVVLQRFEPQRQRWVEVARGRVSESNGAGNYVWSQAYFPARAATRGTLYRAVISNQQTGGCFLAGVSNQVRR